MNVDFSLFYDKATTFVVTHKRWLSIAAALILILIWLSNYGFVFVSVNKVESVKDPVKLTAYAQKTEKESTRAGLKIYSRKINNLVVSQGAYISSSLPVQIPFYGFKHLSVDLQPSKDAEKVAYMNRSGTDCSTYNPEFETFLAYDCVKPVTLTKYTQQESGSWDNSVTNAFTRIDNVNSRPYRGGILAIRKVDNNKAFAVYYPGKKDDKVQYFELPKEFNATQSTRAKVITNSYNATDSRFAVSDGQGSVYVATVDANDKAAFKRIPKPKKLNAQMSDVFCSMNDSDNFYCYYGGGAVGDDMHKLPPEFVSKYSFKKASGETKSVNKPIRLVRFYADADGNLYGRSDFSRNSLYRLDEGTFNYAATPIAERVAAAGASKEGLYYVQNNRLYRYDTSKRSARAIFTSSNIEIKSLVFQNKDVYALGLAAGAKSTLSAYKINDKDYLGKNKRAVDVFPSKKPLGDAIDQQLVGKTLYVRLPEGSNGFYPIIYTPEQRAEFKQNTEKAIKDLGTVTEDLDISYTY